MIAFCLVLKSKQENFLTTIFLLDANNEKLLLRKLLFICNIYVIIYELTTLKSSVLTRTVALNICCSLNIFNSSTKLTSLQDWNTFVIC